MELATEDHDPFPTNEKRGIVPSHLDQSVLYICGRRLPKTYNILQKLSFCRIWMLNDLECAQVMAWESERRRSESQAGQRRDE